MPALEEANYLKLEIVKDAQTTLITQIPVQRCNVLKFCWSVMSDYAMGEGLWAGPMDFEYDPTS